MLAKRLSTPEALALAESDYGIKVSTPTMIKYVQKNNLGQQLSGKNGPWMISETKLRRFLNGEKSKG